MKLFDGKERRLFLDQIAVPPRVDSPGVKYAVIVGALKAVVQIAGDTELYAALERATGDGEKGEGMSRRPKGGKG